MVQTWFFPTTPSQDPLKAQYQESCPSHQQLPMHLTTLEHMSVSLHCLAFKSHAPQCSSQLLKPQLSSFLAAQLIFKLDKKRRKEGMEFKVALPPLHTATAPSDTTSELYIGACNTRAALGPQFSILDSSM